MQLLARISTASSQAGVGARSGIFGYTAEEAIGQPITMIIPKDRPGAAREDAKIRMGLPITGFVRSFEISAAE
jgi:hypothetical protein